MMERAMTLHDDRRGAALTDWLTLERAAYAGIALLALGLRLWGLGWLPLGPAEAAQALPALAAVNGQAPDLTGISPLLFTLQRLIFMLFGATDAAARFWPALLVGLSSLLFYLLRDRLTRGGALVAAGLWAASPLAVWAGRQGVGDALVPALALAALAAASRLAAAGTRPRSPLPLALALGLLLISGPGAYTAMLAGLMALFWWPGLPGKLWEAVRPQWQAALAGFLGALALGATFFTLIPAGLAGAGDLLGRWAQALMPGRGEYAVWEVAARLVLSEPLLLAFGFAGLIWAARWRERFSLWAGLATGLALLAALMGRGRQPADLALVALALTLLAGPAIARSLRQAWIWWAGIDAWLLVAVSFVLLFSAAICLPGAWNPSNGPEWRTLYTAVGLVTAVLAALLWVVYGIWGSWRTVALALPVVLLAFLLAWGLSQTVALNYERGAWRQAALVHVQPATDTADFRETLRQLSMLQRGSAHEVRVDLAWPQRPGDAMLPTLRWQLRDFSELRITASVLDDPAPVVITPVEEQPTLAERYSGTEFALLQRWQPQSLDGFYSALRWVLYREVKTAPEKSKLVLWVDRSQQ